MEFLVKKWYHSRTIILQLVAAVLLVARLAGVEVADGNDQDIVDGILAIAFIFANGVLRFRTTEPIK